MERLLEEVRRLADMLSVADMPQKTKAGLVQVGWNTPCGRLRVAGSCMAIGAMGDRIANAGYRECEKDVLASIMTEARQILYFINGVAAARNEAVSDT
ncbi:hypothetical protein [Rhizobium sp. BK251]|uniref:hypothetical protein n=1 Tax=Rhizobium sp. BK251 TaxID=2512125 RepID=UPI0010466108|nr:hypothetical protein [Rhizobium sp. BK251]